MRSTDEIVADSSAPQPSTAAPATRAGLTIWPLLLGIGLLFVVSVAAVVGASWFAGAGADREATRQSIGQVDRMLAERATALASSNRDWAWWNEAIERFVLRPDRDYIDYNLGTYQYEENGTYVALVVDPDDRVVAAFREGAPASADEIADWQARLWPMLAATRLQSIDSPVSVTAFVEISGQPALVSATAMWHEEGSPAIDWVQPAVLVFARAVDDELLQGVATAAGIDDLRLVPVDGAQPAMLLLRDPDGVPVAGLSWQVRLPSSAILPNLWLAVLAIALVMLAIGGLLCRRLLRYARRYQAERVEREAELSAAMDEARGADHAKSQFLANMSHEIRTPLNAMIGYSEMLRLGYCGPLSPKQAESVASIETASRHLLSLLQDILDIARISAGREELNEEPVDIGTALSKAIALTAPGAREQGIELAVDRGPAVGLHADGRRVLQMLLNLLSNAVRYSPARGTIEVGWRVAGDRGVVFFVADNGPGIPEEDLQRVLQPFHRRLDSTVRGEGESNGLGLPLTAKVMAMHGGALILENRRSGGLIAKLRFPPERTREAVAGEEAAAPSPLPPEPRRLAG